MRSEGYLVCKCVRVSVCCNHVRQPGLRATLIGSARHWLDFKFGDFHSVDRSEQVNMQTSIGCLCGGVINYNKGRLLLGPCAEASKRDHQLTITYYTWY
jgi:hypothetical protein